MAFWNRNKNAANNRAENMEANPQAGQWEQLGGQVPFAGTEIAARGGVEADSAEAAEQARINAERQQNKIVEIMLTANPRLLAQEVPVRPGARERYIEKVANNEITAPHERWLLQQIADPIHRKGEEAMFAEDIQGDKHQMRILGRMTSAGFENYAQVTPGSVAEFLAKYPLPMDFEGASEEFLGAIQRGNTPQKYAEYQQAMKQFKKAMYGKRQEYWEQMKVLDEEAEIRRRANKLAPQEVAGQPMAPGAEPEAARQDTAELVKTLTTAESKEMIAHTEIDGDAWVQNGYAYKLTAEMLEEDGLAPEHKIEFDGAKIGISKVFAIGSHDAVIAYVQTDKGVKARSYYRSNSQGVWRYMPEYIGRADGEIERYGKGYTEESTMLPMELQMGLAQISENQGETMQVTKTVPEFVFCGTAMRYESVNEYLTKRGMGQARGDFYKEVSATPAVQLGDRLKRDYKTPPEQLDLVGDRAPDFRRDVAIWEADTGMYGKVQNEVFLSQDGSLKYIMKENERGQAWLGGIETTGKVTSTGLRENWVEAGDYTTPLYEYASQTAGYGDTSDRPATTANYVGMWRGYLSRMPLVQRYLASKH